MSFIITITGKKFDFLSPMEEMIDLYDIAWALSMLPRFTGHMKRPYSVAEHSLLGAHWMIETGVRNKDLVREFLLHDAHEAYTNDLSSPLKALCPEYRRVQDRVDAVIRQKCRLPPVKHPLVHEVDMRMLATEKLALLPECEDWECLNGYSPYPGFSDQPPTQKEVFESFYRTLREAFPC